MHAHWLKPVVDSRIRNIVVDILCEQLLPHIDEFDTVAVSGNSMAGMGTIIAYQLNKNVAFVRKENEDKNSPYSLECTDVVSYIIVDDLVSTGETLKRVTRKMIYPATCYGCIFYQPIIHTFAYEDICGYEYETGINGAAMMVEDYQTGSLRVLNTDVTEEQFHKYKDTVQSIYFPKMD